MISRKTIFWFCLLVGITAALWARQYRLDAPCREWKRAHPSIEVHIQPVAWQDQENGTFTLCFTDGPLPLWVKVLTIGWLVAAVGFVNGIVRNQYRWLVLRFKRRGAQA
jgi:hypothetical protein